MAYTWPPSYPPFLSQRSRMYCESARSGSAARAAASGHTATIAASTAADRPLRKKRELLNHHLDILRGRLWRTPVVKQHDVRILGARRRHAHGEQPLGHEVVAAGCAPQSNGSERHASRLPAERVRDGADRDRKPEHVRRHALRLHDVLSVHAARIAPAAHIDRQLTKVLVGAQRVPGVHAQRRRGIELRRIAKVDRVGAVAETARHPYFRTRPWSIAPTQEQVQV